MTCLLWSTCSDSWMGAVDDNSGLEPIFDMGLQLIYV